MDNTSLFFLIFNLHNQSVILDDLMIFGARYLILVAFLLFFILAFKGGVKEKKAFLLAILAIPIAFLIIKGIHIFFLEPRPFVSLHLTPLYPYNPDPSFPSRHASIMAVIAGTYVFFKSKWSTLFLTFMLWVGISRIYVGIHYPTDILGGLVVGVVSLTVAKQIINVVKIKFF